MYYWPNSSPCDCLVFHLPWLSTFARICVMSTRERATYKQRNFPTHLFPPSLADTVIVNNLKPRSVSVSTRLVYSPRVTKAQSTPRIAHRVFLPPRYQLIARVLTIDNTKTKPSSIPSIHTTGLQSIRARPYLQNPHDENKTLVRFLISTQRDI